jgi:hypothetical protein
MSGGKACNCLESKKPIKERNWRVIDLKCNYSYFQSPKGGYKHSDYSYVTCNSCNAGWRTKSNYVFNLKAEV